MYPIHGTDAQLLLATLIAAKRRPAALTDIVAAAEFMGASQGLGYLLVDGQQLGKPDQIIASILVFAVLGKLTDALLVAATRPFLRWKDGYAPAG